MDKTGGALALEFAGFWLRLAAFIVDAIILGVITSILFPWRGLPDFWSFQTSWFFIPLIAISNFVSTLITVAYQVAFWTWRGQTPGKMLFNIKVIRTDGSAITLGYSLLRYLGYIVSAVMLGIGFLWIAFDPRKQGIHDKIADTYVVKLPQPTRTEAFPAARPVG